MSNSRSDDYDAAGSEPAAAAARTDAHRPGPSRQGTLVERLSRYGMQVMPNALQRRSRLQRQREVTLNNDGSSELQRDSAERVSLTPAMRKKYLKDLLLSNPSNSGLNSVLSSHTLSSSSTSEQEDSDWALYPMEHAWMLSAVEGNYETILEYISAEPYLLTRRDFVSGYSVLHWLAKRGQDETLVKLLRYAEREGIAVNVNLRGSGGLTPLHLASMHRQFMVIKLLVGAFGADIDAMDYNGKRPWQYMSGDAPLEIKELLGTWDDEHNIAGACAINNGHRNVNNNSTGGVNCGASDEVDDGQTEEVGHFDRTQRAGSWRFGSLRKLLPSFPFFGKS